jgi:hypothetical protein
VPATADEQGKLALWCEAHGLKVEARAHLSAVIRYDPTREAVWRRLGYQKHQGRWMTVEERDRARAAADAQEQANRRWRPKLERWRTWLNGAGHRAEAQKNLAGVTDPRAVPAIGSVFGTRSAADQGHAVTLFGQVAAPSATQALATLADFGRSAEVRRRAVETLRRRDWREAADTLIGAFRQPIRFEVRPLDATNPRSPDMLYVEGKRFDQLPTTGTDNRLDPGRRLVLPLLIRQEAEYQRRLMVQRQVPLEMMVNPLTALSVYSSGYPTVPDPLTDRTGRAAILEARRQSLIQSLMGNPLDATIKAEAQKGVMSATIEQTNATIKQTSAAAAEALGNLGASPEELHATIERLRELPRPGTRENAPQSG